MELAPVEYIISVLVGDAAGLQASDRQMNALCIDKGAPRSPERPTRAAGINAGRLAHDLTAQQSALTFVYA